MDQFLSPRQLSPLVSQLLHDQEVLKTQVNTLLDRIKKLESSRSRPTVERKVIRATVPAWISPYLDIEAINHKATNPSIITTIEKWAKEQLDNPTHSENLMYKKLCRMGVQIERQRPFVNKLVEQNFYFADFYLPEFQAIIEVDGGYHDDPKQKEKDKVRDEFFAKRGVKVIRVDNERVGSMQEEELFKLLKAPHIFHKVPASKKAKAKSKAKYNNRRKK